MKKVYIIGGSRAYEMLFTLLGFQVVSRFDRDVAFAVFTGGEDVSPYIYGDKQHRLTYSSPARDGYEKTIFNELREKKIPMVGICRGAQFLNVMSGGRMYQHVDLHTRSHHIVDLISGETIFVTSTHHQMMLPQGNYQLLAASDLGGSREWYDGEVARRDVSKQDNEVVFYPDTQCLCFQPHPELYLGHEEYEGMRQYFLRLINQFILEKEYV